MLLDIGHSLNTADVSRVISEEETTEAGKSTDQIGPKRDGGLDVAHIRASHRKPSHWI
jgi:hypothetical protein